MSDLQTCQCGRDYCIGQKSLREGWACERDALASEALSIRAQLQAAEQQTATDAAAIRELHAEVSRLHARAQAAEQENERLRLIAEQLQIEADALPPMTNQIPETLVERLRKDAEKLAHDLDSRITASLLTVKRFTDILAEALGAAYRNGAADALTGPHHRSRTEMSDQVPETLIERLRTIGNTLAALAIDNTVAEGNLRWHVKLTAEQLQIEADALSASGPKVAAPPLTEYHAIPREQDGPIRIVLEMQSAAHYDRTMNAAMRSALAGWADRLSKWAVREEAEREWATASEFIREMIEAVGFEQPEPHAVISLADLRLQVVGLIEDLKAQVAEAETKGFVVGKRPEEAAPVPYAEQPSKSRGSVEDEARRLLKTLELLPPRWRVNAVVDAERIIRALLAEREAASAVRAACEFGDCKDHYSDPAAWCVRCQATQEGSPPMTQTLVERLRAIVEYKAAWKRDPNGQFERLAEQFYRETGLMAPGKSLPLEMRQDDAERQQKWTEFLARLSAERDATILEAADALSASGLEGVTPPAKGRTALHERRCPFHELVEPCSKCPERFNRPLD